MSIGFTEIVIILLFVLLIFGAKRIPELAKALGRASYEFKRARESIRKETDDLITEAEKLAQKDDGNV